jgi:hypothetical protein
MRNLLLINGLRFFFYGSENNEPIHIHVLKARANGKIWLLPDVKMKEYEIIADDTGIHWPSLDEDLSVKGFLKDELRNIVKRNKEFIPA